MRYAIVYRDEEDNWIAEVPSLPGCVTQGKTREEVLENIRDAIVLYLEDLDDTHKELYQEYREPEPLLSKWLLSEQVSVVSSRECVRALEKAGFSVISQSGSHIKMRRDQPFAQVIVNQTRELAPGTLRSILRQAGLTIDKFIELL